MLCFAQSYYLCTVSIEMLWLYCLQSYCLKVKEMDDEEYSYAALQEPLYRTETGNYEYRWVSYQWGAIPVGVVLSYQWGVIPVGVVPVGSYTGGCRTSRALYRWVSYQ